MTSSDSPPTIEVSHLPSATSFYAEITQPLGISYLSASDSRVNFGWISASRGTNIPQPHVVLSLQQSLTSQVQRSSITLLANSREAVEAFYRKGLQGNRWQTNPIIEHLPAETRVRILDLDGNMLEAEHSRRAAPGALPRRRTFDIETASTPKEARRVLQWQQEVAKSAVLTDDSPERSPSPPPRYSGRAPEFEYEARGGSGDGYPIPFRRSDTYPLASRYASERVPSLVKRESVRSERYHYRHPSQKDGAGRGLTSTKLMGTLLGAAAGATIAYAAMQSDSPPPYEPPYDEPRRASHGDPVPKYHQSYRDYGSHSSTRTAERLPTRTYLGMEPRQNQYFAQFTVAGPPPTRAHDWARIEERGHPRSYRSVRSEVVKERSRSESGSTRYSRQPPAIPRPGSPHTYPHTSRQEHRSYHSDDRGSFRRRRHESDRGSYVSNSRSQRTEKPEVRYGGATSIHTIRAVPKCERKSPNHIPCPKSVVGGIRYTESVAPSDSVSSVGCKMDRERLRDRMRERW